MEFIRLACVLGAAAVAFVFLMTLLTYGMPDVDELFSGDRP